MDLNTISILVGLALTVGALVWKISRQQATTEAQISALQSIPNDDELKRIRELCEDNGRALEALKKWQIEPLTDAVKNLAEWTEKLAQQSKQ